MGDYNIDLTSSVHLKNPNTSAHENNCTNNNKFLDILSTYALSPCISKPTRITPTSSTLIDNIFTNTINKDSLSGVFYYDISDHLPIFLISMQLRSNNKIKAKTMTHRKESIENIAALKSELEKEQWLDIFEENNVNTAYEKFINKLKQYYDKNIPLVTIKKRKNHAKNPWITHGILNSINTRNKLYKSYICKPSKQNHERYKQYRNRLTNIIRTSKKMHFSQELESAEGDLKSTWKVINKIINKDKPHNNINSINHNNQELTNSSEIANAFNSFFTSIGPDLAANIIDCGNIHFSAFLPRPLTNTIFLNYTNQSEIIDIVQTFKPKTSTGYDGLSMKLLKQIIYSIASPLEYIVNLSLQNGKCPDMLKIAKVIPIHKKTTKHR